MAAVIRTIADAVKADLNAGSFSETFEAERLYVPRHTLEEMNVLKVSVVPAAINSERKGRKAHALKYTVDVGVQKRFDSDGPADVDPLLDFVDELQTHLRGRTHGGFSVVNADVEPLWVPEHMDQFNQFTSVIRLRYHQVAA